MTHCGSFPGYSLDDSAWILDLLFSHFSFAGHRDLRLFVVL